MDASKVRKDPPRRFGLFDAMILVGSVALGLAAIRWFDPFGEAWGNLKTAGFEFDEWRASDFSRVISDMLCLVVPLAMAVTLGVLASRLRKPRPRWRRLVRQPGFVASVALILGWIVAGVRTSVSTFWWGIDWGKPPSSEQLWSYWARLLVIDGSQLAGFAVAVAWATLLLVGRWRAEPSWGDRLGRVIGVAWIATAVVSAIFGQVV